MTTLISFLGAGTYSDTTYVFGAQRYTSCYMADAAARFFQPSRILVFVTPKAEQTHFAALCERLANYAQPHKVPIPSGQHEADQWQMFATIAGQIHDHEELVFDVTSGFRSIPVLALLIANYVRGVRQSRVQRMVYGAFDARDRVTNETPVFDLSPLLSLLDWTTATDAFLKYGRADDLVKLTIRGDGGPLDELTGTLATLTAGLQMSRPTEVQTTAAQLHEQIAAVRSDPTMPAPIGLLLDRIGAEYTPLAHEVPTDPARAREVLPGQAEIVQWYVSKGLYVQAITLAREWLVSWVVARSGGDMFARNDREIAENAINGYSFVRRSGQQIDVPDAVRKVANNRLLREIWGQTRDLRNDLGHTGMRSDPRLATQVRTQVEQACKRLPALLVLL